MNTMHTIFNSDRLTIESGGTQDASHAGYAAKMGPGKGTSNIGGSYASHGGYGSEHSVYGTFDSPASPGSGGGRGAGGGWVEMNVGLEALLEGSVKANGQNVGINSGAGSGGCIVIRTFSLRGRGSMTANGGKFTFC